MSDSFGPRESSSVDGVVLADKSAVRLIAQVHSSKYCFCRVATWAEFGAAVERCRFGVAAAPSLHSCHDELTSFRMQYPLFPLVIITERDPDNLRLLSGLPPIELLLFHDEIQQQLFDCIDAAARKSLIMQAIATIEETVLPKKLKAALTRACRSHELVRTVSRLAKAYLCRSPQTLRSIWQRSLGDRSRPHDFIDWLLIAHALSHLTEGDVVSRLASRTGVDRHVLASALRRRFPGMQLDRIAVGGEVLLLDNLRQMISEKSNERNPTTIIEIHH